MDKIIQHHLRTELEAKLQRSRAVIEHRDVKPQAVMWAKVSLATESIDRAAVEARIAYLSKVHYPAIFRCDSAQLEEAPDGS